jgi:hypothetical protein
MAKLKDTSASGAVFFAVCRGKVCSLYSELFTSWAMEDFCIIVD